MGSPNTTDAIRSAEAGLPHERVDQGRLAATKRRNTAPTAVVAGAVILAVGVGLGSWLLMRPTADALAKLMCGPNGDRGAPPGAAYTLAREKALLPRILEEELRGSIIVTCPGNIQSPGPWRRNATPQQVSGTLMCGYRDGLAEVTWTTDADLLVSDVHTDRPGPTLNDLYQWWSAHS